MRRDDEKEDVENGLPWKQMKDFLLRLNIEMKNCSNQPLFAISFASPVDVKQYNYALIYCIVALSMHELLGTRREDFSPSTPPTVSLSPSPFLCFSSFIYLNVSYVCVGCCGVLMYSVLGFLFSPCVGADQ